MQILYILVMTSLVLTLLVINHFGTLLFEIVLILKVVRFPLYFFKVVRLLIGISLSDFKVPDFMNESDFLELFLVALNKNRCQCIGHQNKSLVQN